MPVLRTVKVFGAPVLPTSLAPNGEISLEESAAPDGPSTTMTGTPGTVTVAVSLSSLPALFVARTQ